ncbi:hypothetical protein KFL_000060660 [Klebsormidium nitens]|uniref:Uncharacterized protein n=1 Tax=Klebsormidium nitens TaxID=105231 RepID=A0A0U9HKL5_KLENI|nr:hypothetical protein KFL_000060660 [Klebsormidium nitens]|eukprot:GAQ78000.1 hypothetical protein KFL_000060660 [Klebsormidium nitens]
MGNLFSCLGSGPEPERVEPKSPPKQDTKRRTRRKVVATEDPAEPEGLRPFKRPPSKHRQQWVEHSTSSGTTAGIRPGGSSISTMGSMVSSNTLPVNLEQERRALGKKDWEDGLPSPVQENGPSWEQVEELNGEVSDLRQRLMHEKEEANRLKLMVEKLRVSNSGVREASPDAVLTGTPLPPGPEQGPLSSVLATQRSAQQDTCESVVGANGSPEQMSRLTGKGVAERDGERTEAKQPPSKGSGLLGLSLDAQDMVELGSPIVSSPPREQAPPSQQNSKPSENEPLQRGSKEGGESADDGSGEPESSSERDYRSSGAEGSLENDRRARRTAPPLGPPSGVLIARRKSHGPSGERSPQEHSHRMDSSGAGKSSLTGADIAEGATEHLNAASNAKLGEKEAGPVGSAAQLEEADAEAAARREALRRQSRQDRAKARLARRQANQAAEAAGRSPTKDVVRQPLAESHLSQLAPAWDEDDAAAEWAGGSVLGDGHREGVLEWRGPGAGQRKGNQTRVDSNRAESDSDMSFGGWLPDTRAGRGRADHLQSEATNKPLRKGSYRASSLVDSVAEEEPSDSFSFGKRGPPSLADAAIQKLASPAKLDSPGKRPSRTKRAHKSPIPSPPQAPALQSDDSMGQEENERREPVQLTGAESPSNPLTTIEHPERSPRVSSPSQLLNTRERLALKGVMVGAPGWGSPKDRALGGASGRVGAEARARKALWEPETKAEELLERARQLTTGALLHSPEAPEEMPPRISSREAQHDPPERVLASPTKLRPWRSGANEHAPSQSPQLLPPAVEAEVPAVPSLSPLRRHSGKGQDALQHQPETPTVQRPLPTSHVAGQRQPAIEAPVPRRAVSARTTASAASSAGSESVQVDNPFRIGLTSSQASVQRGPGSAGVTVDQPQHHRTGAGAQVTRVLARTSSEVESRKPPVPEPKVARSRSFDAPNPKSAPRTAPQAAAHSGLPPRPTPATGSNHPGGGLSRIPLAPHLKVDHRRPKSEQLETDAVPSPFRTRERLPKDSSDELHRTSEQPRKVTNDAAENSPETPPGARAWANLQEVGQLRGIPRDDAHRARPSSSSQSAVEPPVGPPSKPKHRRRHSHGSNGELDAFSALPEFKENADPRPSDEDDVMRRLARSRARNLSRGGSSGEEGGGGTGMWEVQENTVEVPGGFEDPGTPTPVLANDGRGIPNRTDKYKEDQKVRVHSTPFEIRVERVIAKQEMKQRRIQFPNLISNMGPCTI